jgi:hypothetical protein
MLRVDLSIMSIGGSMREAWGLGLPSEGTVATWNLLVGLVPERQFVVVITHLGRTDQFSDDRQVPE